VPRCPKCRVQADLIKYEGVTVYNCGSCGGHWLTEARLDVILKRREVVMPEPVRQKMMDIADASDTRERLLCITCGVEMVKERFKYWDDIILDRCPKCNGLWLDRSELEKCQVYWEYAQDHPEEWENRGAIEKQALAEAQLAARREELRSRRRAAEDYRRHPYYGWGMGRLLRDLFY
jgi:Zn-finger nucleic acid-binding protein